MFIGHYAVGFALKRVEPKVRLGTLLFSALLVDVAWGAFVLLGWERVRITPGFLAASPLEFIYYPISHSLLAAVLWGLGAAAVYYSWPTRDTSQHHTLGAAMVGAAVASHWVLDAVVHTRDLPLTGDQSTKVGLGLWSSIPATLGVELGLLALGLFVYFRWRNRGHSGSPLRVSILIALLLAAFLGALFGPTPGSVTPVAIGAIANGFIALALGNWVDVKQSGQSGRSGRK